MIPLDFFEQSLTIVNNKLIDKEEEEVVNELRYNFWRLRFCV